MMRRVLWGLAAAALGALGFVAASALQHLLVDHQRVDQIWDLELRRAQAVQQAPAPLAPGASK